MWHRQLCCCFSPGSSLLSFGLHLHELLGAPYGLNKPLGKDYSGHGFRVLLGFCLNNCKTPSLRCDAAPPRVWHMIKWWNEIVPLHDWLSYFPSKTCFGSYWNNLLQQILTYYTNYRIYIYFPASSSSPLHFCYINRWKELILEWHIFTFKLFEKKTSWQE